MRDRATPKTDHILDQPTKGDDPRTNVEHQLEAQVRVELGRIARLHGGPAFPATDNGLVQRYLQLWRDRVLFCPDGKGTYWRFDGTRWTPDRDESVGRRAWAITAGLQAEIDAFVVTPGDAEAEKRRQEFVRWVGRSQSMRAQQMILAGLRARVGFDAADFDPPGTDTLLNTPSGVVELPTGRLLGASDPALRITKATGVDFRADATCPRFRLAVDELMCGRADLVRHLQMLLGAALLPGLTRRVIAVFYGPRGANGKSTLCEIVGAVLGDYAGTLAAEALMEQRNRATHDEALAPLIGTRFVFASEGGTSSSWNAPLVKLLSGGDSLTLRRIYGRTMIVRPTASLFLSTNHAPNLERVDGAMRDRLRLIPFEHQVPPGDRIPDFAARLVGAEGPGILNWLLEGTGLVAAEGLGDVPAAVRGATDDYLDAVDEPGRYFRERTVIDLADRSLVLGASTLYRDYRTWCAENCVEPLNQMRFGMLLNDLGVPGGRDISNRTIRRGIRLLGAAE